MEGWHEVTQIQALRIPKSQRKQNAPVQKMITAIAFDDSHELLWVGDSDGYIYSYSSMKLVPYTSFKAHDSPVLKIMNHKRGLVSIGTNSVRLGTREGLCTFNLTDPALSSLTCMAYTSNTQTEILVGTLESKLFKIDLIQGVISSQIPYHVETILMETSIKYAIIARSDGKVDIFDPKTDSVVHTWATHSSGISNIVVRDEMILATGLSRRYDTFVPDPIVSAFDVKNLKSMTPIPFPIGASYVKLHPKLRNVALIASQTGQMHFVDITNPVKTQIYLADVPAFISHFELSTSGECLAFTDAAQNLYLWANNTIPSMTVYNSELKYVSQPDTLDIPLSNRLSFDNSESSNTPEAPLNGIKLPPYKSMLLSAWPPEMKFEVGKVPTQIDPEILRNSEIINGYRIASYNKQKYGPRNVIHKYKSSSDLHQSKMFVPKFLSEKDDAEKQKALGKTKKITEIPLDVFDFLPGSDGDVPNAFKAQNIMYSKFGVDDFDFNFYNNTRYAGLETDVDNSYTNSFFQLYRFIPELFNFVISTLAEDVKYDDYLLAELGYLFDMLVKAEGRHCAATNFQRLFKKLPNAKNLGLLSADNSYRNGFNQRHMAHNFNRFALETLSHDEANLYKDKNLFQLDQLVVVTPRTSIRSSFCGLAHDTTLKGHSIDVSTSPSMNVPPSQVTILDFMDASMNKTVPHMINCDVCNNHHRVDIHLSIQELPPVVFLNTDFNGSQLNDIRSSPNWLVPEFYSFSVDNRLILRTNNIASASNNFSSKYQLLGYVAQITSRDNTSHLVTVTRIEDNDGTYSWYLFNDFLVEKIPEQEALNFTYWWKTPVVVVYQRANVPHHFNYEGWKQTLDDSILYRDHFAAGTREGKIIEYELLTKSEAPKPGTIVAVDAEFVMLSPAVYEFKSNGIKNMVKPQRLSLARVSVLMGEGPKEGQCFIDDYIVTTEAIAEYNTSFSGIEPGDLDPSVSKRPLVSLQTAYRKLWLLLNLGCVFVGHSLTGDFRTINIQVPPSQVRDTADYFYLKKEKRKLGLKFLCYILFNELVQTGNHDSIEDAKNALALYKKYLELRDSGELNTTLQNIYNEGQYTRFRVPDQL